MKSNIHSKAMLFYFFMGIILLDFGNQIRKICVSEYLKNYSNPIFKISTTTNTGSAFGMLEEHSYYLALVGIFAVLFLTYYVYKKLTFNDKLELLAVTLFSFGTLGNLIERLKLGHVIDYIKLNFIDFPIFNAFDIMICLGTFLYFVFVLYDSRKLKNGNFNNKE